MDLQNVVLRNNLMHITIFPQYILQLPRSAHGHHHDHCSSATLPLGRFMASVIPTKKYKLGPWEFSFNPGPFNVKEHVLISMFANAGAAFGSGTAYAIGIVDIIRALHEKEDTKTDKSLTRGKFFAIALICAFSWQLVPGYLFSTISNIAIVCLAFPKSVLAHQIGSGLQGLGIGTFAFDWNVVAAFNGSPLVTPFFAIVNIAIGYTLIMYVIIPTAYWGFNLYNAKTFPFFSSHLFTSSGKRYNVRDIVNSKFELDFAAYEKQGRVNLSTFFALTYGLGFAAQYRASSSGKEDIHTRLMKKYKDIPNWWFYILLVASFALSLVLCIFMKDQIQMPWWALIFAAGLALLFTLPVSVITATTNQTPGLNIITEYIMGLILPGQPIANVCFKTYGYISMAQAVSFLNDFKLGHYMKVPPRSMFLVQFIGTLIAGTANLLTAWYFLNTVKNICQDQLLPEGSTWTCRMTMYFSMHPSYGA
ncbi:Oligopeptide transporter 2 [Bienertia sinuspersici]